MKAKNIKLYKEKFSHLADDAFERLTQYLADKKFNKREKEKFLSALEDYKNFEYKTIRIILDIIPEQTPRPRFVKGHVYVGNSRENNAYMKSVVIDYNKDLHEIIKGALKFKVDSYLPIPKSFSRVDTILAELGVIRPLGKPDWDNLGKTYSDMIQPWIIHDDSNIVDGESHKYYSLKPRVEIQLEY